MATRHSQKDRLAGLIFIAIGLAFGYATFGYELGTAFRMGPGYIPLVLAGILTLLGVVILLQSMTAGPDAAAVGRFPWLGLGLITGALVFFGVTVRGLGLAPALFVTAFLSAVSSERTGVTGALVLAAFLTLVSILIFVVALGLPLPVLGRWLDF
ncbi:MAG: tripartite tricarboxylate transporter TctB family protein [Rhodobacteraceae bacterium]|nr:tripartite tricarboxylate transporter TctB family protein [Paracoccaceae bacterium]